MHLAEGRRGQRLLLELREEVPEPTAELGLDDLLDIGERERLRVVLQSGERGGVRRRQQVEPGREQLPELDEGGPELLEVAGERRSLGLVPHRWVLVEGELVETGTGDEVGAPEPGQQAREGRVPSDVSHAEHRHGARVPTSAGRRT